MKANELMIGDWVTLKGVDFQWQWTHHDFTASEFNTLEPIPLTREILEKNKFSNKGGDMYYYEDSFIGIKFDGEGVDDCRFGQNVIYLPTKKRKICYVHELQHALRLCGIEELADNFEI